MGASAMYSAGVGKNEVHGLGDGAACFGVTKGFGVKNNYQMHEAEVS
jgi:hypothetical protein